jgi:hypothetical protein
MGRLPFVIPHFYWLFNVRKGIFNLEFWKYLSRLLGGYQSQYSVFFWNFTYTFLQQFTVDHNRGYRFDPEFFRLFHNLRDCEIVNFYDAVNVAVFCYHILNEFICPVAVFASRTVKLDSHCPTHNLTTSNATDSLIISIARVSICISSLELTEISLHQSDNAKTTGTIRFAKSVKKPVKLIYGQLLAYPKHKSHSP